ncbi:MAG: hypothetical protein IKR59_02800 [Lachnospiraceae bacterium]|nr:hypothetical protein [Lachnospiraceae bacterium]
MSALALKLTAMLIMLVDHTGVVLYHAGLIARPLYRVMRVIGRGAFPIFCFQIVEGAKHTKKKWFYFLRILALAFISDVVFDFALFSKWWDLKHQNVFFTLALGLLVVFVIQWAASLRGKKIVLGILAAGASAAAAALFASKALYTDYGASGVLQIAVMGLLVLPLERIPWAMERAVSERMIRVLVCAAAITVCAWICKGTEWWAYYALIPIALYNGRKGYKSKALQYALYFFYPLHLLALGLIFILPRM